MEDERIDISEPLREISDRLGLEYHFIRELVLTPFEVIATVYMKNDAGEKYTVPTVLRDGEELSFSATPAVSFRHFQVTT